MRIAKQLVVLLLAGGLPSGEFSGGYEYEGYRSVGEEV